MYFISGVEIYKLQLMNFCLVVKWDQMRADHLSHIIDPVFDPFIAVSLLSPMMSQSICIESSKGWLCVEVGDHQDHSYQPNIVLSHAEIP